MWLGTVTPVTSEGWQGPTVQTFPTNITQFQESGTLGRSCWRGAPWLFMPAELARFSWPTTGRVIGMGRESMQGGWMQGRQYIKCLFLQGFHRPPMTDGAKAPRTAVFWFAAENMH